MRNLWKTTVMGIVYAMIVYIVASFLVTITTVLTVASGMVGSGTAAGSFLLLTVIFLIAMLAGFVWFFINLSKFITLQKTDDDAKSISNVRTAYILVVVGVLVSFIPLIGWIVNLVCQIVAYILLIIAFGNYSNSRVLGMGAKSGASLLKTYAILALICGILLVIPVINFLALIGLIVAWILMFMGWVKIANDAPREEGEA